MTQQKAKKGTPKILRIVIALVAIAVAGYFGIDLTSKGKSGDTTTQSAPQRSPSTTVDQLRRTATRKAPTIEKSLDRSTATPALSAELRSAIASKRSEVMVTLTAEVVKNLPDDNDGSRHQRLLLELPERVGKVDTILIAHNIDLAKRVPVDEGDIVTVRGQYEWNDRGGVIHWTHHDPRNRREGGWIEHDGKKYE